MRASASLAVCALVSILSAPARAESVSEDRARDAISAYENGNFQSACNKFADLQEKQDAVSIYYLGYDVIFGGGKCMPITKDLPIYKKSWQQIVDENHLKDKVGGQNSSMMNYYVNGGAAAKMIEVAANAGYMPAQTRLGQLYMQYEVDTFLPRNLGLAANWLQKASASGGGLAEYLLAVLSINGDAPGTAAEHYTKAADRGHLYSMQVVAQSLYTGSGGFPKDQDKALTYLNKMANQDADFQKKRWAMSFIQNYYQGNVHRQ
jgi:TPR repeat protein